MKIKNILIINHYATPSQYGGLNRHHYFAKYLQEEGYVVTILSSSAVHNSDVNFIDEKYSKIYKKNKVDGVDYLHIKTSQYKGNKISRIVNMLQFYFRTKRVLRTISSPDIVYTSSPHPLNSLLGIWYGKKRNISHFAEIRDLWPASFLAYDILKKKSIVYKILYLIEKKIYIKSDKIIFTMENGIKYLKEQTYYPEIDSNNVFYLNNGVDLKEFNNNLKKYKTVDIDLDDTSKYNVVYAGSLRFVYNLLDLIDVAEIVHKKGYNNINFLLYGRGPLTESLKLAINSKKLSNVKLKGYVEHKYLPYILSKCHLGLFQVKTTFISRYGGSGNKMFLYMAAGLPIISTFNDKNGLVIKGKCGTVLNSYDKELYANEIIKFYKMNKSKQKEYSENSRKYIKKFDYKNLTKKLVEILEEK